MESFYEINVSVDGNHLFATATRSLKTEEKAKKLAKLFKERFPESEGYEVSLTYWEGRGTGISIK